MSTIMPDSVDKVNQSAPFDQLHRLVHRIKRLMQQATVAAGAAEGLALVPMEARALGFFARQPGATAQDLVDHAGRDKAQVARLVKGLVERGLLAAAPDPADRRRQTLTLTAAGQRFERRMAAERRRIERAALAELSAAEVAQLERSLAAMLQALDRD